MMVMQFDGKVINLAHVQYAKIVLVSRVKAYDDYYTKVFFTGGDSVTLNVAKHKEWWISKAESQAILDRFFKEMAEALQKR